MMSEKESLIYAKGMVHASFIISIALGFYGIADNAFKGKTVLVLLAIGLMLIACLAFSFATKKLNEYIELTREDERKG